MACIRTLALRIVPASRSISLRSSASAEPGPAVATNNFGFASRYDYPFARTNDRQFIIGIFGGSVGAFFCRVGSGRFEDDLRQSASFKNKELVTLCFSHEGYKQPQQLLVLSYFLSIGQPFDLVVNIDGFNEVALGRINDQYGWDISMPSHEHLDPLINLVNQATLTSAELDSLYRITHDRQRLNDIAAWNNRTWFASVDFVLRHYYAFLRSRYEQERVDFRQAAIEPASELGDSRDAEGQGAQRSGRVRRHRRQLELFIDADGSAPGVKRHPVHPRAAAEPVLHDARLQR